MDVLISIVTINLNNIDGLKKTVESVLSQDYKRVEYIIIDGGSIDGGFDFIQSKQHYFDYWISEKDNGIYDAMNKGISASTGEYLLFLNSGDFFSSKDSLSKLLFGNVNYDIVYGNIAINHVSYSEILKYPYLLSLYYFRYATLPHQATLIKKNLFSKFGFYNTEYKIVSDWIFFCNVIISQKVTYKYIDKVISIFDLSGVSSQPSGGKIIRHEVARYFKEKYFFSFYYFQLLWAIKYYPKRILSEFGFISH